MEQIEGKDNYISLIIHILRSNAIDHFLLLQVIARYDCAGLYFFCGPAEFLIGNDTANTHILHFTKRIVVEMDCG